MKTRTESRSRVFRGNLNAAVRCGVLWAIVILSRCSHAQSGSIDLTFDPGTGTDGSGDVESIAVQTNGQIVIVGTFASFNGTPRNPVARLNANGSLDTPYDAGAVFGSFPFIYSVRLQASGKAILGGSFTSSQATNLARLNTDGSFDHSFTATTDANGTVNAVAVQTNGSVVIGGAYSYLDGLARTGLGRVGTDGAVDGVFNPTISGGFGEVNALALQLDGKILVAGSFTNANFSGATNLARLNTNGTSDPGFHPSSISGGSLFPAIPGILYAVAVDAQGRIIAGGDFSFVNGLVRTNLVRFNSDGTLDNTFSPAAGTDSDVNAISVQSDGKILIAGSFAKVNGMSANHLARLKSDGMLDASFDTSVGANSVVYAVALQPDVKVLIGGGFTMYNSTLRNGMARLQNSLAPVSPVLMNPRYSPGVFQVSVQTISGNSYVLEYKNALGDSVWTPLPAVSGDGTVQTLFDNTAPVSRRFYHVHVY